ncbi:hypothetical protein [Lentzea sp. NEAU-D7]|uniref:hypothetical protein n=1 Tax=Lentzea sp. NEAU-D7 TaxID=2994667 RepID=UPI00224AD6B1|nr:hypothetical protein [Lentzea sp. NEAU-D7]MCX2950319.1 hypothetical protein [Lentzea sp. NEAU-D7]
MKDEHHAVPLRRAWVLPLTPTTAVLLIAIALVPVTGSLEAWLPAVPVTAALLAAVVAAAAGRVSGEPAGHPWPMAVATGVITASVPFVISGLLGEPAPALVVVPWLIFGLGAGYWQLHLCEGARSRPLHAAIGFSNTFVFAAVTLLFAVVSARLAD